MNSKFNTSNEKPHPCADLARRMSMEVSTRLLDLKPTSYSAEYRTVDAVLSTGSAVARIYGTEVLKISPDAVDLTRVHGAGVPVLDSHQQIGLSNALGVLRAAWVEDGALIGTLQFNQTYEGKKAEGMVARRELNDDDLVFTASKWSLLEISLCNVPADDTAGIRAYGDRAYFPPPPAFIADVRARMGARQRMHDRHQAVLRRCSNA